MEWTYDINMFKETFETSFTYLQGFMRNVRRYGSKTAMFDPEINKSWTYKELNKRCIDRGSAMPDPLRRFAPAPRGKESL